MAFWRLPMSKECELKAFLYANTLLWGFFIIIIFFGFWKQKHNGTSVTFIYIWIPRIHFQFAAIPGPLYCLTAFEARSEVGVYGLLEAECRNVWWVHAFLQKLKTLLCKICVHFRVSGGNCISCEATWKHKYNSHVFCFISKVCILKMVSCQLLFTHCGFGN